MSQQTVLVISDEADFSRMVVNRWQTERNMPAFTVMSSQLCAGAVTAAYDLAIIGAIGPERLKPVIASLAPSSRPVIFVAGDSTQGKAAHDEYPRVLVLRQFEGWLDALMLLGSEGLRRVEAQTRAERAEMKAQSEQRDATLGRYMAEMRHALNNALTSVLGNAELLLLEPGAMPSQMREQVATIHNMALRIHEIVQRFSSLEMEMNFEEKASQGETKLQSQLYASGS